ncbi:MAG: hypothetical protein II889_01840 [Clostridia bacterium]|nr:hypothetical protein [Clostridia bacterium]
MKPKVFVGAVSVLVLFFAVFCPVLRLAETLGWVELPQMGNLREPAKEWGVPFLDAAERFKAGAEDVYVNDLPGYAHVVTAMSTARVDFSRSFNALLTAGVKTGAAPTAAEPDVTGSAETEPAGTSESFESPPAQTEPEEPAPEEPVPEEPAVVSWKSRFLKASGDGVNLYAVDAVLSDGETVGLITSAFSTPERVYTKRMETTAEQINAIAALAPDVKPWVYVCSRLQDAACFSEIIPGEPSTGPLVEKFFSLLDEGIRYDRLKIDSLDDSIKKLFLTDHHWNAYGMYEAYCDIVTMMFGEDAVIRPLGVRYDVEGADYYGTFARTSGYRGYHDSFFFYDYGLPEHELIADKPCVFAERKETYLAGKFSKDISADHYVLFYPYARYLKYPENHTGRVLLLLGDSYSRGISELLSSAFDEAYIFDYRRIREIGDYRAFVEEHGITDVLFMQYSLRGVFNNQNDNTLDTLLP